MVGHDVRSKVAMHAKHSHVEGMVGWYGRESKQGRATWYLCLLEELLQLGMCVSQFHTLSYKGERLHAIVYHPGSLMHHLI